ncbi:hypothetical protein BOTBODRAFT_60007 [Botryobasidium botryosum FD-172 SS1]|uniref:BTB domain-containing protein n=1 Tax=Botryobasidium botryosum (strain FD-172 SS1) TaxID=930990 RepID=A0A067M6D8_BOTB1|nr:hypothetical protein BOTBODRAFT_60007 [Botryobasidium botryosum FD-172 SS1]
MFTGPVSTSLHISGCPTDISKPTIHLLSHNAAPTFCIPWADMSQIISSDNLNVEILIVISQWDGWHEVSRGIHTPSIRNFAAFARLLGALDAPENHDVAFHFPRGKRLYADRNVLQRESPYFRTMFRSGFQESGEHEPAAPSRKCVIPFEDSDEDSDAEDDGVKGCSPGELPEAAPSIPSPTGGVDLPPVHERSMSKIYVSDASYRTMRAVLYYIYSDHIAFAPLRSLPLLPSGNTRETVIQAYLKTNPVYPTPVSSKSVYALAHKYEISALQVVALHHYKLQITKSNVFTELFSAFCRLYEQPKTLAIEFAINNWGTLKDTSEWRKVVEEAKINPDFHYVEVTSRILNRWPR